MQPILSKLQQTQQPLDLEQICNDIEKLETERLTKEQEMNQANMEFQLIAKELMHKQLPLLKQIIEANPDCLPQVLQEVRKTLIPQLKLIEFQQRNMELQQQSLKQQQLLLQILQENKDQQIQKQILLKLQLIQQTEQERVCRQLGEFIKQKAVANENIEEVYNALVLNNDVEELENTQEENTDNNESTESSDYRY